MSSRTTKNPVEDQIDRLIAALRQAYAQTENRRAVDWQAIALISRAVRDIAERRASSPEALEAPVATERKHAEASGKPSRATPLIR